MADIWCINLINKRDDKRKGVDRLFSNIFINNQDMIRMSCCSCGCGCDCNPKSAEADGRKGGAEKASGKAAKTDSTPSS